MSEKTLEQTVKLGVAGTVGFLVSYFISHPSHPKSLRNKLPEKRIKNVQILPNIKITHKEKEYWLHHWASYASLYAWLLLSRKESLKKRKMFHAFMLGTIMQGLTYKDRFKFIHTPKQSTKKQLLTDK